MPYDVENGPITLTGTVVCTTQDDYRCFLDNCYKDFDALLASEQSYEIDNEKLNTFRHLDCTLTAIRGFNFNSTIFSTIFSGPTLLYNRESIGFILQHINNKDIRFLTDILKYDMFNFVLRAHEYDIKSLVVTNKDIILSFLLSQNEVDLTEETQKTEISFIVEKFKAFFNNNHKDIVHSILSSDLAENFTSIIKQINSKENVKKAITAKISGLESEVDIQNINYELNELLDDQEFLNNIFTLITHEKVRDIIKKFCQELNWDEYENFSNEVVSNNTDQIETYETKHLKHSFISSLFSLFDDFSKYGEDKNKFAPFLDTLSALKYVYFNNAVIEPTHKYLAKIRDANPGANIDVADIYQALQQYGPDENLYQIKQTVGLYEHSNFIMSELSKGQQDMNGLETKAIIALVRNLRPFIEESHNDAESKNIKAIATLATNSLIGINDNEEISPNETPEQITEVVNSDLNIAQKLNEIVELEKNNVAPLKSLHLSRDGVEHLIVEVLKSYSDPKYRDEITSVLLKFIPALLEKNMTTVIEESIHAIALNDQFRDKIKSDPGIREILINILISDLKFGSQNKSREDLANTFELSIDEINDIDEGLEVWDGIAHEARVKATANCIKLFKEADDTYNIFDVNSNLAVIDKYIKNKDTDSYVFGIRISVLTNLLEKVLENFVDNITNSDLETKMATTKTISWFVDSDKNPNDLFKYMFKLIQVNDDMKRILSDNEAKQTIIDLLEDILTVSKDGNLYINNTVIRWQDMQGLISRLLTHLPNKFDQQENEPSIMQAGLDILGYLCNQDKTSDDSIKFFKDIFNIIQYVPDIKDELADKNFREEITSIIVAAINNPLTVSKLNSTKSTTDLKNIIEACIEHSYDKIESSENTRQAILNILEFFVKEEKNPTDNHNFYANIFTTLDNCPSLGQEISKNSTLRNSISSIVTKIIKNSSKIDNKVSQSLEIVIDKSLGYCVDNVGNKNVRNNVQTILDFFAHYSDSDGNTISKVKWLSNILDLVENSGMTDEINNDADTTLLKSIKNVIDGFTPAKWLVKTFVLDLDETRIKLLLTDTIYRKKFKDLMNNIESSSWLKIFTIPTKTLSLLGSLFWQRAENRAAVFIILAISIAMVSFSLLSMFSVLAPFAMTLSIAIGMGMLYWKYNDSIEETIKSNKKASSYTFSIISGVSFGISLATVSYSLVISIPLFVVSILACLVFVSLVTNNEDEKKPIKYHNKLNHIELKTLGRQKKHQSYNNNNVQKQTPSRTH